MTSGDVVYTSQALAVSRATVEGNTQTTRLTKQVSGGFDVDHLLIQKTSSPDNSPFDVTKQYIVEVKEA